jgi:hypothetical protein
MRLVMMAVGSLVILVIGLVTGLTLGYALWGQDASLVATLSEELEKTKEWLLDEISWSDERQQAVSAALTKTQTDLAQVRRELARARANADPVGEHRQVRSRAGTGRPIASRLDALTPSLEPA